VSVLSPLWHAVELCRGAITGGVAGADSVADVAFHVAVLLVWVVAGWRWGARMFEKVLTQ
jgi:hypothetical protein